MIGSGVGRIIPIIGLLVTVMGIARLFGPLHPARALIGALAQPVAVVPLFVLIAIVHRSGNWQVYRLADGSTSFVGEGAPHTLRLFSIVAGGDHTCGLTTEGRAYCWGSDERGELGIGGAQLKCAQPPWSRVPPGRPDLLHVNHIPPRACALQPTAVAGTIRFRMLAAGRAHTCGIAVDSVAYCWGKQLAW